MENAKQYRRRLPKWLYDLIPEIKLRSESDLRQFLKPELGKDSTETEETENGVRIRYTGGEPITSREAAINFFEINTKKYEVVSFVCKSWSTTMKLKGGKDDPDTPIQVQNYGVTIQLKNKAVELSLDNVRFKKRKIKKAKGSGSVLVPLTDFHIGAYVGDLLKTKDFSFDILCGYLDEIANSLNKCEYKKVHLQLLGDFIESFTGLNHINSWKGLHKGSYGMSAVILTHEILAKHLYSKINNLASVDFCSGNHDRVTSNNKEDVRGEVGQMIHYLFEKDYPSIESKYSDMLIKRKVDGIGYISTHGHLGLSKKDTGKIVQDYGIKGAKYHVVLKGHLHSRQTEKHLKKSIAIYEDVVTVQHDSMDYRKITLPPLFTGNFYSESLGFTSTAGYSKFRKNEYGKLEHTDIEL